MKPTPPIFLAPLLARIDQELIQLLRSLTPEDWQRPTLAGAWTVKDIAGHLLDGNLRSLSMLRDGYFGDPPDSTENYRDLVGYLNQLNADWVRAYRRISPAVLLDELERSGREYCAYMESLDPFATALFSVAWAGESESANWFHIAREYTEKWHHQQQIRRAVDREALLYSKEFYFPYLDTSMRALPHHYSTLSTAPGTCIQFTIQGAGGGDWFLIWDAKKWNLTMEPQAHVDTQLIVPETVAWRIFTKGIDKKPAIETSEIIGKTALAEPFFDMIAVMA
jgi:uncharacterized protein (TIGR03083 family)